MQDAGGGLLLCFFASAQLYCLRKPLSSKHGIIKPRVLELQSGTTTHLILNIVENSDDISLLPKGDAQQQQETKHQTKKDKRIEENERQSRSSSCSANESCTD